MKRYKPVAAAITVVILITSASTLISKEKGFLMIDPDKISRYNEDRIVFQRIEKIKSIKDDDYIANYSSVIDNSVENLLVIKDKKIYFLVDGLDIVAEVAINRSIKDALHEYVEENDFWVNKINGKPDYVRILYRRNDLMINSNEEFVTTNFGQFYKTIRDRYIKLHVDRFRQLLRNRTEAGLKINKKLLSFKVNPDNKSEILQKFYISAKAKANDGTVYFVEDADGDGITETFTATRDDGFDWGLESGPNLLLIRGNTDKDLETLIGKLVNESVNGTVEEEKKMFQQFPSEKDIINLMDQITPAEKMYE